MIDIKNASRFKKNHAFFKHLYAKALLTFGTLITNLLSDFF